MKYLLRYAPLRIGVPAGFCIVGLAALLLPGASPEVLCAGWLVVLLPLLLIYSHKKWSCPAGGWVLLVASVALWLGICINCHYFIGIHPHADVSAPVLMNLDAWSAWNNALTDVGRSDAMPCPWPAYGYGHFVGLIIRVLGPDLSIALMFNSFCALATILLCGCIAAGCIEGSSCEKGRLAWVTMLFSSLMFYFMVSGTILIKDCPLALAISLSVWAGLQLRGGRLAGAVLAVLPAAVMVIYMRPNFLLFMAFVISVAGFGKSRRNILGLLAVVGPLIAIFCVLQASALTATLGEVMSFTPEAASEDEDGLPHTSDYSRIRSYYLLPVWKRLLLLPVLAFMQFMIPLPFNFGKYIVFGPTMALAHFGFCRYALGALLTYFGFRMFRCRVPARLATLACAGLVLYLGIGYCFAGAISRYCIPLISLFTPAAAYCWLRFRHEKAFRIWAWGFSFFIAAVLITAYFV